MKDSTCTAYHDYCKEDMGYYENNGLKVEYISRGCTPVRNIILKFKVSTKDYTRIDLSSEEETEYFQSKLDEKIEKNELDPDDLKAVNDFVAQVYYELIA